MAVDFLETLEKEGIQAVPLRAADGPVHDPPWGDR